MDETSFQGVTRSQLGSRAAERLRHQGRLPVNIYGHKQDNRHVTVDYKSFDRFIVQGHRRLMIDVDGVEEHGVVKEIQYDPLGSKMVHVDVTRVDPHERIVMNIPVETVGVAKGLSSGGSTLDFNLTEVHVEGPASLIPEHLEVQIGDLEVGHAVRIKDLETPAQCIFQHDPDEVVLMIHEKRGAMQVEELEAAEAPEMPEVISKKKDEEEAGTEEGQ